MKNFWKNVIGTVVASFLALGSSHSQQHRLPESAPQGEAKEGPRGWPVAAASDFRIAGLKQRLEKGDHRALDEFWQEVNLSGTPLIEPMKDGSSEVIATFVWRGNQETENVALLAPLTQTAGLPNLPLTRLLETDIWYGSWRMRDDLRFSYRFAPNVKAGQNVQQFAVLDPLNPHKMEVTFEGGRPPATELSIASMPRAPEEKWIAKQSNVPPGKVELHTLKSSVLGSDRTIWVYTPPDYNDKSPQGYRLMVLFDGFCYLNWIPAPTILDNLIHAGKIAPTVAVLIDNPPESRMRELVYNPEFVDFLSKEVLPWVHEHWNVTGEAQKTIVGGYSVGGAAAAFAAMERPELFGNVLSQSGSFWSGNKEVKWEWLVSQYKVTPKVAIKFFLEAGSLEDASSEGPTLLAANQHLAQVLREKGYTVTYKEIGGTHEPVHWRDALADGLASLAK